MNSNLPIILHNQFIRSHSINRTRLEIWLPIPVNSLQLSILFQSQEIRRSRLESEITYLKLYLSILHIKHLYEPIIAQSQGKHSIITIQTTTLHDTSTSRQKYLRLGIHPLDSVPKLKFPLLSLSIGMGPVSDTMVFVILPVSYIFLYRIVPG